jgi:23S rRNA (adenine2503-C2)-methyltransferase
MKPTRANFHDLTREELRLLVVRWGFSPVHAARLWAYVYLEHVDHWALMPELPARFRAKAEAELAFTALPVATESHSRDGFTKKYLLSLADDRRIETVLMRFTGRVTACISSQAGCAMGCVFCATGQMGFARHLSAGEIVAQALHVNRVLRSATCNLIGYKGSGPGGSHGERLRNIVLMGMGEPLHNYDAVMTATEILCDSAGLSLGTKQITLSTVGVVPGIRRLADEGRPIHLAVSLHGATQAERAALVPVAKKWPLDELMDACRYYIAKQQRRIFYEWTSDRGEKRFRRPRPRRRSPAARPERPSEPDPAQPHRRLRRRPHRPGGGEAFSASPQGIRPAQHRPPAPGHRHRRRLRPTGRDQTVAAGAHSRARSPAPQGRSRLSWSHGHPGAESPNRHSRHLRPFNLCQSPSGP